MSKVFVKVDSMGRITSVNSDAFITNTDGWIQIDEGETDRYRHAQGNYFPLPLMVDGTVPRYKMVGGKVAERTSEEIQVDIMDAHPLPLDPFVEIKNLVIELTHQNAILADLIRGLTAVDPV